MKRCVADIALPLCRSWSFCSWLSVACDCGCNIIRWRRGICVRAVCLADGILTGALLLVARRLTSSATVCPLLGGVLNLIDALWRCEISCVQSGSSLALGAAVSDSMLLVCRQGALQPPLLPPNLVKCRQLIDWRRLRRWRCEVGCGCSSWLIWGCVCQGELSCRMNDGFRPQAHVNVLAWDVVSAAPLC